MTVQARSGVVPDELAAATKATEANALFAAGNFGRVLRATPEFTRLALAGDAVTGDRAATAAIDALQRRQAELRVQLMFGTITEAERGELEALRATMLACPAVAAYLAAQAEFQAVCRETAAVVSNQIGVDFAASCRAGGCCG